MSSATPFFFVTLLCLAVTVSARETPVEGTDPPPEVAGIRAADIQAHVDYLASDALSGRHYKSKGAQMAVEYIAERFGRAGLAPHPAIGNFRQHIEREGVSPNVVAIHRGTGSKHVLVTAHYDHLRPARAGKDRIYNGADDNASGVAALLEIAEALGSRDERPHHSIVLVAFTGEEAGLLGSRHFVASPPFPLESIVGVLNLDMISRGKEDLLYVEGAAAAPIIQKALKKANERVGLDLRFGEHPEWIYLSDQLPFIQKGVPAVYVGVDYHEDYHKVTDHADKILAKLAERATRLTYLAALDLARE